MNIKKFFDRYINDIRAGFVSVAIFKVQRIFGDFISNHGFNDWTPVRASLKWYHHKYANQKRETEKKPILETIVEDSTGDVTPVFEDADSMVNSASTSEILIEFLGDVENMVIEYFRPLNTYADIGIGC